MEDDTTFLREYVGDEEVDEEFAVLPPDADERTIVDLAARMGVHVAALVEQHPALLKLWVAAARGERFAQGTFARALRDVYHPAQFEVMRRVSTALQASSG